MAFERERSEGAVLHPSRRQEIFAFAGLWDRSYKADGTAIESCALLTMPGNDLLRQVHNTGANPFRMPAILTQVACEVWLNGSGTEAKATLRQYPQEMMVAYQVGRRVNSPKNDDRRPCLRTGECRRSVLKKASGRCIALRDWARARRASALRPPSIGGGIPD